MLSMKGIPPTPQHSDSHPCTSPPFGGHKRTSIACPGRFSPNTNIGSTVRIKLWLGQLFTFIRDARETFDELFRPMRDLTQTSIQPVQSMSYCKRIYISNLYRIRYSLNVQFGIPSSFLLTSKFLLR